MSGFFSNLHTGAGLLATIVGGADAPLADKAVLQNGVVIPVDAGRQPFWADLFATLSPGAPLPRREGNLLLERLSARPRLIVCGGGHIAVPLCAVCTLLDFELVLIDDRPEFANAERFPGADQVICASFSEAFTKLTPREDDYYVIITRGHRDDRLCLTHALERASCYVGMIGSRRKVGVVMDELRKSGWSDEALARVHAPIGLHIGAQTPAEIAVCIAAQLIEVRSSQPQGSFSPELLELLATRRPLMLATVVEKSGSAPRGIGAKLVADENGNLLCGTIGGGAGEAEVLSCAPELFREGHARLMECDMTNADAAQAGMVCGGRLTVLLEPLL